MTTIKEIKISLIDMRLASVIKRLYTDKKEIYINEVLRHYTILFNEQADRKALIKKIKNFEQKGFVTFYHKIYKGGKIPSYIQVTDKFLMYHKLVMLMALLMNDEQKFHEVAEPTLNKLNRAGFH
jgi:hypothetical protein